jgi:hypothetical protein
VGILQQGVLRRIAAPAQIIRENTKGDVVRVVFEQPAPLPALAALEGVDSAANSERWHVLYGGNIGRILSSVAQYASATRNGIVTIQTEEASLEDAYLSMTRTEEVT